MVIRVFIYLVLNDAAGKSDSMGYQSISHSIECIFAVLIYFVPKILDNTKVDDTAQHEPDLFLNAIIMHANICGFTAWSSVREPGQIFKFLETVYVAFDNIAEKRKIFKVETTRDCYSKFCDIMK